MAPVSSTFIAGGGAASANPRAPVFEQVAAASARSGCAAAQPVSARRRDGSPTCTGTSDGPQPLGVDAHLDADAVEAASSMSSSSRIARPRPLQTL